MISQHHFRKPLQDNTKFDVIVVGSGFGGAITGCRLAEAGARVLILERGRRWTVEHYPREPGDAWLYEHTKPHRFNGWLDLRFYRGMAIALGAGVGGGSLCYSSVVMEAPKNCFDDGWPPEITYQELTPYYHTVREMLGVQEIPSNQYTQRYKLLQQGAERIGQGDRFKSLPLAISFDPEWNYNLPDPIDERHSKTFINAQGQKQGTCIHLGDCDLGCTVKAKNTLDLNYIPRAEQHGAEVRALHLVQYVKPENGGYRVFFENIESGEREPGSVWGERVILAAGSLGSTEILLRSRDQYRTLPEISPQLGHYWSANANVLTPDFYPNTVMVRQSIGPTISAALDYTDGHLNHQTFIIEDDGFPNILLNALTAKFHTQGGSLLSRLLHLQLQRSLDEKNPLRNVMIWLGAGVDAGNGQLYLKRQWLKPWQHDIDLKWTVEKSTPVINSILKVQQQLSLANGGKLVIPFYWRILRSLLTVHPLGGCKMGTDIEDGVVNHQGEVFGHPNLFVADGAVIPRPIGLNPSMTIAALAERTAHQMIAST